MNNYLPFTTKTKMADVIHRDYQLIPIIGRFGINYGFGNKNVLEVCENHGINVWFFLEIINSFHNHTYFPKEQLQNFSVEVIIDYLSKTHQYYSKQKVPEIQSIIDEMENSVGDANLSNVKILNNFYKEYKQELQKHLDKEEFKVFPYILSLEEVLTRNKVSSDMLNAINNDPIEKYEDSHENMEIKLGDLKNLIMRHLPPNLCKELCQKLLTEIFRLESDLENHTRIEEKVLVPKVKLLEEKIIQLGSV